MQIELFGRKVTRNALLTMLFIGTLLLIGAIVAAKKIFPPPLTIVEVEVVDVVPVLDKVSYSRLGGHVVGGPRTLKYAGSQRLIATHPTDRGHYLLIRAEIAQRHLIKGAPRDESNDLNIKTNMIKAMCGTHNSDVWILDHTPLGTQLNIDCSSLMPNELDQLPSAAEFPGKSLPPFPQGTLTRPAFDESTVAAKPGRKPHPQQIEHERMLGGHTFVGDSGMRVQWENSGGAMAISIDDQSDAWIQMEPILRRQKEFFDFSRWEVMLLVRRPPSGAGAIELNFFGKKAAELDEAYTHSEFVQGADNDPFQLVTVESTDGAAMEMRDDLGGQVVSGVAELAPADNAPNDVQVPQPVPFGAPTFPVQNSGDVDRGRGPLRTYLGQSGEITDIALQSDGQGFLSVTGKNSLFFWSLDAEEPRQSYDKFMDAAQFALRPSRVAISPDGKFALIAFDGPQSGSNPMDLNRRGPTALGPNAPGPNATAPNSMDSFGARQSVKVSPEKTSPDGSSVVVWDLDNWQQLSHVRLPMKKTSEEIKDIRWFADGQRSRLRTTEGTVFIYDRNEQQVDVYRARQNPLALCPTGSQRLLGSVEHTALIRDTRSGRDHLRLMPRDVQPSMAAFSEDGQRVVIGGPVPESQDFTLVVFDVASGSEKTRLTGLTSPPKKLVVSPLGRFLASVGNDGKTQLWNVAESTQIAEVAGGQAVFTPDGKHVVLWDANQSKMTLLTAASGELVDSYAYEQALTCLRFVPGSNRFLTGHQSGTIHAWELPEPTSEAITSLASTAAFDEPPVEDSIAERAIKIRDFGPTHVEQLAISAKGTIVAAVGAEPNVHVMDSRSGRQLRLLEGHEHPISALALSADGRFVLSGENQPSAQNHVRLWDNRSGKVIRTIELSEVGVTKLALAPDARTALLAKSDQTWAIWDLKENAQVAEINPVGTTLRYLGFTADGQRAVTLVDTTLQGWNTKTGEEAMRYENPQAPPTCAALGPSTSGVVVGTGSSTGNSGTIVMVSLDTGEVIQKYIGHEAAVEHVAFSADGSQLISTAQDNSVRKWDVASGRQIGQVTGLQASAAKVAMRPDESFVLASRIDSIQTPAVGGFRNPPSGGFRNPPSGGFGYPSSGGFGKIAIALWGPPEMAEAAKVAAGKSLAKALANSQVGQHHRIEVPPFQCVTFAADNRNAVCGGDDNQLRVVDLFQSKVIAELSGHQHPPYLVFLSMDGQKMLSADQSTALIWNSSDNTVQQKIKLGAQARLTTMSPNGQRIATLTQAEGQEIAINVFDLETAEEISSIELDQAPVALAFGASSRKILAAFSNGVLIAWDARTGKERKRTSSAGSAAAGTIANVQNIVFSPTGKRALIDNDGKQFTYMEVNTGKGKSFSLPPCDVALVVISNDGRRCLIPSTAGKLALWDIIRKQELASFAYSPPPRTLAISPDGRLALSSHDNASLTVWSLPE